MAALFIGVVMAFPNGLAGLYESHVALAGKRKAARGPAAAQRPTARSHRRRPASAPCDPACPAACRAHRLNRTGADMSNTDFVLAVEDLTVSFDGFKAIDALTCTSTRRAARDHRPQRRRQDHAARPDLRQDAASAGSIKFKNQEMTKLPSTRSCARASAASSRRRRSTKT
jgi:hypothetical protein